MISCLDVAGSHQRAGKSMRIAEFSAAVACLVVNLCILEGACASEDTTVAAALKALAYVPAADTAHSVDAANTRPSVFATQTSPTDLPYGTPACACWHYRSTRMCLSV